ncbi:MAG: polysaccharide pyruvyl transferase family protein [[Clostridium] fimetarium]|nr:polysaccharide pyruvyl transferase family protein [Alistipes timonensis]MCM1404801.1 polysaccharide pyruvyl transferase family protein [[Clostridium] fimetarium]
MKSVGILSMQEVPNYGSFLQAYALRRMVEAVGVSKCSFIGIERGDALVKPPVVTLTKPQRIARKLSRLYREGLPFILKSRELAADYYNSFTDNIAFLPPAKASDEFDVAVIGSDEVFNCCQPSWWGFTEQLFGKVKNAHKVITYAASFGHTTLDDLNTYGVSQIVARNLRGIASISVRDENSALIVEKLTDRKPQMHIDPVLAYGYSAEIDAYTSAPLDKDYIVVYSYGNRITDKEEAAAIRRYAKTHKKKLVAIMGLYPWCDVLVAPKSPFEVLRWFKYASGVVTDTFHGTIFSAITHRPFVTLIRESNKNKLTSLLETIGQEQRQLIAPAFLSNVMDVPINFKSMDERLSVLRTKSYEYLRENV